MILKQELIQNLEEVTKYYYNKELTNNDFIIIFKKINKKKLLRIYSLGYRVSYISKNKFPFIHKNFDLQKKVYKLISSFDVKNIDDNEYYNCLCKNILWMILDYKTLNVYFIHFKLINKKRYNKWVFRQFFNLLDINDVKSLKTHYYLMKSKKSKRYIPQRIRFDVFNKDNYTCQECGKKGKRANGNEIHLTIDHKVPIQYGGSNHIDNLQILCFKCNLEKRCKLNLNLFDY